MRCFPCRWPVAASLAVLLLLPITGRAQTGAPDSLSFQGYVTDSSGVPVNTPSVSMTFKLYKSGADVWKEAHPSVAVENGVFNVLLGGTTPLDTMAFNAPLELGILVDGDPEISPRTPLAAAAYAKALPGLYTFYREGGLDKSHNVVGGASNNVIGAGVVGAAIGGGRENVASGLDVAIGGGEGNTASGELGTIGGGTGNTASGTEMMSVGGGVKNTAGSWLATVKGGQSNTADGVAATVGGGTANTAGGGSTTVGGGSSNTGDSTWATVPGGGGNIADGQGNFAAGSSSHALHSGTFVWNGRESFANTLVSTGANQFLIGARGGVGIGTNSPGGELHVSAGLSGDTEFLIGADPDNNNESDNPILRFRQDGGLNGMNIGFDNTGFGADVFGIGARVAGVDKLDTFVIDAGGDVGIGTTSPGSHRLKIDSNSSGGLSASTLHVENSSSGSGIAGVFVSNGTDATLVIDNNSTGDLIRASASGLVFAVRNNGDVNADGGFTTPAADLAEVFEVDGPTSNYEPGDVLVISTQSDRMVALSSSPVSNLVAGVYATKPGVRLGTPIEGHTVPMGVVGVLPTKVSSQNGPIRRGDLLVTSSTPGHAMRADPVVVSGIEIYPPGAILGKALEPFDGAETGLIEVLVRVH